MRRRLAAVADQVLRRLPDHQRPAVVDGIRRTRVIASAIGARRPVRRTRRIGFLAHDCADLVDHLDVAPGAGEVRVEVHLSAMSTGTEIAQLTGLMAKGHPYWPGYSGTGVVTEVGRGVSGLVVGDRVAGRIKHASHCNVDASTIFRVPPDVAAEDAALLELAIIAAQGVRKAGVVPGDAVAVIGQGVIGLLAARIARTAGGCPIIGVASSDARRSIAVRAGGCDRFVVTAAIGDLDAVDVVLESSGAAGSLALAMTIVDDDGRIVVLGSHRGPETVRIGSDRRVRITGAHISDLPQVDSSAARLTYLDEGAMALRLVEHGMLRLSPVVSGIEPPGRCNEVYDAVRTGDLQPGAILFDWTSRS